MPQGDRQKSLPKRIEQIGYAFEIRIFNEALRIVDGDVDRLTDEILDQAYEKVIRQYVEDQTPKLVYQLHNYDRQESEIRELQRQLEKYQYREAETFRLDFELKESESVCSRLKSQIHELELELAAERYKWTQQIEELQDELHSQQAIVGHTSELLKEATENNGLLKQELVTKDGRLRNTRNALIAERGISDNLRKLLDKALNKPQKTRLQRILSLALTLGGGGVAFTVALPVFIASIIAGNGETALQAGLLALGGFAAASAVEINFLGLFEPKERLSNSGLSVSASDYHERELRLSDSGQTDLPAISEDGSQPKEKANQQP